MSRRTWGYTCIGPCDGRKSRTLRVKLFSSTSEETRSFGFSEISFHTSDHNLSIMKQGTVCPPPLQCKEIKRFNLWEPKVGCYSSFRLEPGNSPRMCMTPLLQRIYSHGQWGPRETGFVKMLGKRSKEIPYFWRRLRALVVTETNGGTRVTVGVTSGRPGSPDTLRTSSWTGVFLRRHEESWYGVSVRVL